MCRRQCRVKCAGSAPALSTRAKASGPSLMGTTSSLGSRTRKHRLGASQRPVAATPRSSAPSREEQPLPPSGDALSNRAAFLLALILGAAFGLHRIMDPDVFLQTAVGRAILREPATLGVSTFIDAYPKYPYVEDKWLASVLAALANATAGSDGLMVYQIVLCMLAAGAWYWMQRAWGASPAAALVGVSLALLACSLRLEPRPDTLSHALLAVAIGLVGADLSYRRLLWVTPLLLALWVNLHGYFVNGLVVLVAATAGTALGDQLTHSTGARSLRISMRERLILFVLGVAACVLHPQGWHALISPASQILELRRNPAFRAAITEFSPSTEIMQGMGVARWLLLGASAVASVVVNVAPVGRSALARQVVALAAAVPWLLWPPPGLLDPSYRIMFVLFLMATFEVPAQLRDRSFIGPLLLAGFTILAIPLIRNVVLIVPAALILFAPAWTRTAAELGRRYPIPGRRAAVLCAALLIVIMTGWLRLSDRLNTGVRAPSRAGWGIDTDRFPAAAASFIERERLTGPLLNNFDLGGYLLYRLHPDRGCSSPGTRPCTRRHFSPTTAPT